MRASASGMTTRAITRASLHFERHAVVADLYVLWVEEFLQLVVACLSAIGVVGCYDLRFVVYAGYIPHSLQHSKYFLAGEVAPVVARVEAIGALDDHGIE